LSISTGVTVPEGECSSSLALIGTLILTDAALAPATVLTPI
jgi:hypothetical protein